MMKPNQQQGADLVTIKETSLIKDHAGMPRLDLLQCM